MLTRTVLIDELNRGMVFSVIICPISRLWVWRLEHCFLKGKRETCFIHLDVLCVLGLCKIKDWMDINANPLVGGTVTFYMNVICLPGVHSNAITLFQMLTISFFKFSVSFS